MLRQKIPRGRHLASEIEVAAILRHKIQVSAILRQKFSKMTSDGVETE